MVFLVRHAILVTVCCKARTTTRKDRCLTESICQEKTLWRRYTELLQDRYLQLAKETDRQHQKVRSSASVVHIILKRMDTETPGL